MRVERLEKQLLLVETYAKEAIWHALDQAYRNAPIARDLSCIVCGHMDRRNGFSIHTDRCQFGGGDLERFECPECGCIFGAQKYLELPERLVDLDYRLLYSRYAEGDSSANEVRTFHSLDPRPGGLYLDWGCGGAWSTTVDLLRGQGWDVWGFEPSAETAGAFVVNRRESISARFDGIFSNNVIEHFRDPIAQFRDFHAILKPGGRMAHSSPCYEYDVAFTRFHTLFLTGRSAETLAARTGFQVTERVHEGKYINVVFERLG
jgi:SAM-dependent methyltransferase